MKRTKVPMTKPDLAKTIRRIFHCITVPVLPFVMPALVSACSPDASLGGSIGETASAVICSIHTPPGTPCTTGGGHPLPVIEYEYVDATDGSATINFVTPRGATVTSVIVSDGARTLAPVGDVEPTTSHALAVFGLVPGHTYQYDVWIGGTAVYSDTFATQNDPNSAYRFGARNHVDTSLAFSEFFDGPFTLGAWVMPEFQNNYYGPVFSVSGTGEFSVGAGNYEEGDAPFYNTKATGGGPAAVPGNPVLAIRVADQTKFYLAPGWTKNRWHYLAVVRTPTDASSKYSFQLYLDGERLHATRRVVPSPQPSPDYPTFSMQPDTDPTFMGTHTGMPYGSLRLGRRSNTNWVEWSQWQYYGLLDDVTVIKGAAPTAPGPIVGTIPNLIAGWTFDKRTDSDPRINRPTTAVGATLVSLGVARNDAADSAVLAYMVASGLERHYVLPFSAGQVWTVIQGNDDGTYSHRSGDAFAWDLGRVDASSAGSALYVNAPSMSLAQVILDPNAGHVPLETMSFLRLFADTQYICYLHTRADALASPASIPNEANSLTYIPQTNGAHVATDAPGSSAHVHYMMDFGDLGGAWASVPTAFFEYDVSVDRGMTWHYVAVGRPTKGQYLRQHVPGTT